MEGMGKVIPVEDMKKNTDVAKTKKIIHAKVVMEAVMEVVEIKL